MWISRARLLANFYRDVTQALTEAGYKFHRQGKGSHEIWIGPKGDKISVPANLKVRHTANAILKDAGLDKKV